MRYGMLIELDRCVGCKACVSACKERWDVGPGATRNWVQEIESGTREGGLEVTFYPGLCMQCELHPCTSECPTEATWADEHGVVRVDADLCIGCGNCVDLCPYGARSIDPVQRVVQKCDLCTPYVERGEQPACVTACLAHCRHFGDLEDPSGTLAQLIVARDAKPLTSHEAIVGPNIYYAPDSARHRVLEAGVIRRPRSSRLTRVWQGASRPAARIVPAVAALTLFGGLLVNLRTRTSAPSESSPNGETEGGARPSPLPPKIVRHRLGMRILHWYNALSWVLLLVSGTALMASPAFALFGTKIPHAVASLVVGAPHLLAFHVVWGLTWAALIVPGFLYFKRGGIEALREIRLTRDDLCWLWLKPRALFGRRRVRLPPQDKYNAGQKLFAISALLGTITIITSGLVMTFHLGSATVVAGAILVHKLAILFALAGLSVHLTMAAILEEERPALGAMLRGTIDRSHSERHNEKWLDELERSLTDERRPS